MWSDLGAWFASPAGQRALTDAVLPAVRHAVTRGLLHPVA